MVILKQSSNSSTLTVSEASLTDRQVTDRQVTGESDKHVPERLRLLQEVHLVLHAAAGFELLHHHLGGVQACVHLPQQNLKQRRQTNTHREDTQTDRQTR